MMVHYRHPITGSALCAGRLNTDGDPLTREPSEVQCFLCVERLVAILDAVDAAK